MIASALLFALAAASGAGPYDADPAHPWNRLHAALVAPDCAADDADALLWGVGDVAAAQQSLAAFLDAGDDRRIADPLARALLQRDLWAAFDAADVLDAPRFKGLLAAAIRRLALSAEQIAALPAPASGSGVPEGLFDAVGPWVALRDPFDHRRGIAPAHAEILRHRSAFQVHLALPGGRDATLAYLRALREFPQPILVRPGFDYATLNPDIPQVPIGTRVALVRRALLIAAHLEPVISPLVESIEMRTFRRIEAFEHFGAEAAFDAYQQVFVAVLDRRGIARGRAVRVVEKGEQSVSLFRQRFVGRAPRTSDFLASCASCHAPAGIFSVNTWKNDESGCATDALDIPRFRLPRLLDADPDVRSAGAAAVHAKRGDASFGELRVLWSGPLPAGRDEAEKNEG